MEKKLNTTIVGLLIGGLFTLGVAVYQEYRKTEMERVQFESSLILNSIDKGDIEASKRNIKFLIESGLISNKNEKIIPLLTDTTFSIKLPQVDTVTIEPLNSYETGESYLLEKTVNLRTGQVLDKEGKPVQGVKIFIDPCYDNKSDKFLNCNAMTLTDKNGLFKVPLPDDKQYTLLIQKEGFKEILSKHLNSKHIKYAQTIELENN